MVMIIFLSYCAKKKFNKKGSYTLVSTTQETSILHDSASSSHSFFPFSPWSYGTVRKVRGLGGNVRMACIEVVYWELLFVEHLDKGKHDFKHMCTWLIA